MAPPPIIDGQQFLAPGNTAPPPAEVAHAIAQAASAAGFFQLINHGADAALLARMTAAMHAFFDLPLEDKLKARRTQDNAMGYANDELTKQTRDLKELFDFCRVPHPHLPDDHPDNHTIDGYNRWPQGQPELRAAMMEYYAEVERCSFRLLEAFCLGLGLERTALHHLFKGQHTGFLRLNYYPVLPEGQQGQQMGVHHHTDAGFLTILVQDDVPGLQMLDSSGQWQLVEPIPGALTINVGDQCQVLSNDRFKAPLHRVLPSRGRKRYSAPFFFNPRPDADISPLPMFIDEQHPPAFRPINWGRFRSLRFAGDYADVGEEVQISHYRLRSEKAAPGAEDAAPAEQQAAEGAASA